MPTAAEAAYARLQRKLKLEQERLARLLAQVANKQKAITAASHRTGAFVRNKYLSDPLIVRLLSTHGGLKGQNIARLALSLGKQHARPTMAIGRNIKNKSNTQIANAKRRYNAWYNSLTPNQKKQRARNYNRELGGAGWYNLNILRNLNNLTSERYNNKELARLSLFYASRSSAPHVKNLRNLIWKRNRVAANWEPRTNRTYNNYRSFGRFQRSHGNKTYYMNEYTK
jgi:hypothetical protein